jgi:hypothetical protein
MNILYAYNPRTASLAVAKFVLSRYGIAIQSLLDAKAIADDFAAAILDVMTQQTGEASDQDLQTLLSAGNTQGDDAGRIEGLRSERDQFHAALSPAVKEALNSISSSATFRQLFAQTPAKTK